MPGQSALTSALSKGQPTRVDSDSSSPPNGSAAAALACAKTDSCPRGSFPCLYVHEHDRQPLDPIKFDDEDRATTHEPAARFIADGADEFEPASYRRGSVDFGRTSVDGRSSLDGGSQAMRWAKLGSPAMASSFMGPESVGSLPKGLPPDERARLSASTPMTPSLQILSSMPPESVSARTKEARRLRRRLLKSTVLVFIVAGYEGKRFIYERAKELNIRIVIIDEADSWSRQLLEEGVIERFIPFDFSDQETVFDRCMAVMRRIEKDEGQIDGVLSFWELSQALVSRLAEALGLPGNPPSAVDAAREKQQTRAVMAQAGLASPKNILIHSPADLPAAAAHVGFPSVLKPITGGLDGD
ncbi:hypothetical protein WJX84_001702 [Apatococcus fuscideae]|uniref:ATP-grasp domain-containing protein n=1 Tax=Apatococcus fuscideae TaxID=2026836 RepID=A0AAW1SNK3_9CHLO